MQFHLTRLTLGFQNNVQSVYMNYHKTNSTTKLMNMFSYKSISLSCKYQVGRFITPHKIIILLNMQLNGMH